MSEEKTSYLSKSVLVNGEMITLYSQNGVTWLSKPDDIPSTMERLENHRITLNDPKAEGGDANKKVAKERFKPRGPRGAPPTVQSDKKVEDPEIFDDMDDDIDDLDDEPMVAKDGDDDSASESSRDAGSDDDMDSDVEEVKAKPSNVLTHPAAKKAPAREEMAASPREEVPEPKKVKEAPKLKAVPAAAPAPAKKPAVAKAAPAKPAAAKAKPKAAAKPAPKAAAPKKKVEKKPAAGKKKK